MPSTRRWCCFARAITWSSSSQFGSAPGPLKMPLSSTSTRTYSAPRSSASLKIRSFSAEGVQQVCTIACAEIGASACAGAAIARAASATARRKLTRTTRTRGAPGCTRAAMTHNGDVAVRLDGTRKTYGDVVAVDRVDLDIREDEFFTLLGPSGSGKATCLRMIAGFERPDEGRVELGGFDVTDLPPYERDVNTVFQDYALFPHMSVAENVEYGLRIAKVGKEERRRRASDALEMVRLGGYEQRRPAQLSGGQRQRVALARALVKKPKV